MDWFRKIFKKALIFIISVSLLVILIIGILSVLDIFNPQRSRRLELMLKLGLVKDRKIVTLFEPHPSPIKITEPTDIEFYYKDQDTLNPAAGFECRLTGLLVEKQSRLWKLVLKNGQTITVDISQLKNQILPGKLEEQVSLVGVGWDCPGPKIMLSESQILKGEYLSIIPKYVKKN